MKQTLFHAVFEGCGQKFFKMEIFNEQLDLTAFNTWTEKRKQDIERSSNWEIRVVLIDFKIERYSND